jgi:biopolymer transport protein ExbD/biopolymer transport protein TolR
MAFGRIERKRGETPMSEINMTPLIDVMLVLLVIFMLTAPLMTSALKLNLPATKGTQKQPPNPKAIQITLTADNVVRLDDAEITPEALADRLQALKGSDTEVRLRADRAVPYGQVAEVLGLLKAAELRKLAFVTDPLGAQSAQGARPAATASAAR